MEQHSDERTAASTRFAPWWVYLGAILGTNYLRKAIVGEPSEPSLAVAVALAFSAALFAVITLVYRFTQRPNGGGQ